MKEHRSMIRAWSFFLVDDFAIRCASHFTAPTPVSERGSASSVAWPGGTERFELGVG
jgi:hypothetical protein